LSSCYASHTKFLTGSSLGWDVAGIVESVGKAVTLFRPGQAVYYAGSFDRAGSNAQFHLVDERIAGRMPAQIDAQPLATNLRAWRIGSGALKARLIPPATNA
jgi:NADPH:quinone reductase-like Zn-dependent oxidoreductase